MGVFDRYAPFVQDFIYSHDWENLRGIQVAAAEAIFDTDDNVLLTASTASTRFIRCCGETAVAKPSASSSAWAAWPA